MKESTMATIKEVAAAAGVSYQAVSAVLNGKLGKASPATRERIYQAAARLNYRPNRLARGLVLGRSGMIGLVMQDIRSPYFADLTWELQNAAERAGFQVLTMVADWSESGTLRCLEKLSASGIDGIVLLGNVLPEAYRRRILPETFPLVLIDDDDSAADGIGFDYLPGMEEAFLHLLESGAPDRPCTRSGAPDEIPRLRRLLPEIRSRTADIPVSLADRGGRGGRHRLRP